MSNERWTATCYTDHRPGGTAPGFVLGTEYPTYQSATDATEYASSKGCDIRIVPSVSKEKK